MAVGARASHDTDDIAVGAVRHDRGIAVAIVATEVCAASHALRARPSATHVIGILRNDIEFVGQVAIVLQAVVGEDNEAVNHFAAGQGLLDGRDGGDAVVLRAAVEGHQCGALAEEDGHLVLRVASRFGAFGAADGIARHDGIHSVAFGGLFGDVVGYPEIVVAHTEVFAARDGERAVGTD